MVLAREIGLFIMGPLCELACAIIACNLDGFLSSTLLRTRLLEVEVLPLDSLLTARVYYFYPQLWIGIQQSDLNYPVCPSFQDRCFPRDNIRTNLYLADVDCAY